MRADLLAAGGIDRNKIDKQPHAPRLELWRQLRPELPFTKREKHPQQEVRVVPLEDHMAPKDVLSDAFFHFG